MRLAKYIIKNCLKKIAKRYRYSVCGGILDSHDRTQLREVQATMLLEGGTTDLAVRCANHSTTRMDDNNSFYYFY